MRLRRISEIYVYMIIADFVSLPIQLIVEEIIKEIIGKTSFQTLLLIDCIIIGIIFSFKDFKEWNINPIKQIIGIEVISNDNKKLSRLRLFFRNLLVFCFGNIEVLSILIFNKSIVDYISRTKVVLIDDEE